MKKKELLAIVEQQEKAVLDKHAKDYKQQLKVEKLKLLDSYKDSMSVTHKNFQDSLTALMNLFDTLTVDPAVNFCIHNDYNLSNGIRTLSTFNGLESILNCCTFDSPTLVKLNTEQKQQVQNIKSNYTIVKENVNTMTPKEAESYLKELGFPIEDSSVQQALVKPVDTTYLFLSLTNKDSKVEE